MANNHEQFIAFNESIRVTTTQKNNLRTNRNAIRTKIKKYYADKYPNDLQPKFRWQGSFAMNTILNPIKDDQGLGTYDLDDGIYFISDNENDRLTITEYHNRIFSAIKGHTCTGEEDNDPCVTILYADGHHVDLPIYFKKKGDNNHPQLAHKGNGWMDSDPKEFYEWFNGRDEHPQLRRIVRYLKAWCENVRYSKDLMMPTGCILTMLAVEHYKSNDRDDVAMKDILVSIYNDLSAEDGFHCLRPTFPEKEDLFQNYSKSRKEDFLSALKSFKEDAERAIASVNQKDACYKWQKHFGDRFCCSTAKDEDEDAQKRSYSGTLNNNSRFAEQ